MELEKCHHRERQLHHFIPLRPHNANNNNNNMLCINLAASFRFIRIITISSGVFMLIWVHRDRGRFALIGMLFATTTNFKLNAREENTTGFEW